MLGTGPAESLFVVRCHTPTVGAKGCVRGLFGVTESVLGLLISYQCEDPKNLTIDIE